MSDIPPPPSRGGRRPKFGERTPTIRDVALAAGVSIGTVSKALNGQGRLRDETRAHVRDTALKLGFRPNDLAQALHRGKSLTVGMISSDSFGRFTMPIMEGLEACLADEGISVFLCNAADDPVREKRHIEHLMGKRVDGLIFTARRADHKPSTDMSRLGIPTLYVYATSDDPGAVCLVPDDQQGARLAVAHLARLGRKRIAYVTGPDRFEAVRLRGAGCSEALVSAGLAYAHVLNGSWTEDWGHDAVAELFAEGANRPDAIFCGSDLIARGVIDGLRERGISIPGEVAVIGYDNWDLMATATRPKLTSVDMNLNQLGREAGTRLMAMIRGEHQDGGIVRLPCTLVVRQSCGGEPSQVQ